jgi:hypothetical protein
MDVPAPVPSKSLRLCDELWDSDGSELVELSETVDE